VAPLTRIPLQVWDIVSLITPTAGSLMAPYLDFALKKILTRGEDSHPG